VLVAIRYQNEAAASLNADLAPRSRCARTVVTGQ